MSHHVTTIEHWLLQRRKTICASRSTKHYKGGESHYTAFEATNWLTKEGIPLRKYGSLTRLLKDLDVPNIDGLDVNKHIGYSSYNTATDLLKSISNVINKDTTEKLKQSPCISILTVESTVMVHQSTLCPTTTFSVRLHIYVPSYI